jgi:hypothetical protein
VLSAADCERIEAIAREHLPSYDWRVPYESAEHGRWDSIWARDWGDLTSKEGVQWVRRFAET